MPAPAKRTLRDVVAQQKALAQQMAKADQPVTRQPPGKGRGKPGKAPPMARPKLPPRFVPRLPHDSRYHLRYDGATGVWTGTLTVPEGDKPTILNGKNGGVMGLLRKLDKMYRKAVAKSKPPADNAPVASRDS